MKLLQFLFALCLIFNLPAKAAQSGDFTYTATATEVTISGYTGAGGAVTIPSSVAGLPVRIIGRTFLYYNNPNASVTSVTIPSSVTTIESLVFAQCTNLTNITIPNSVTSIGDNSFVSLNALTSVSIPNSVTSIGSRSFTGCNGMTSVIIGSGVTSIGSDSFRYNSKLTAITVNPANFIFSSVSGVLINAANSELVVYPLAKIGSFTIPNNVTSISSGAFNNCTGLTSVTIPNSVTSIGSDAFNTCTGLTSVTIPSSVTNIGSDAFYNCSGLTSMTLGSSVASIGKQTFRGCISLTSVTIPPSVTSIGDSAFAECNILETVFFQGNAPSNQNNAFSGSYFAKAYYLAGASGWGPTFGGMRTALWIPLAITRQPSGTVVNSGGVALFGVTATGSDVKYQWRKEGVNMLGSTSELLFLSNVQLGDAGDYTVVVSDGTGIIMSTAATLIVNAPPVITGQPSSSTVDQDGSVIFSVTATGATTYQWQRNGSDLSGKTGASLSLTNVQVADAGSYTVIVGNGAGNITSNASILTVNPKLTQAQYDAAVQVGRDQVANSPNSYGLYSLSQVQALHVGTPLLAKDLASGKFKLTIGVEKSTNLVNFSPMAIPVGAATINAQGMMEFQFTSPDNAAFYRLESH
jgi:hypothetical protein